MCRLGNEGLVETAVTNRVRTASSRQDDPILQTSMNDCSDTPPDSFPASVGGSNSSALRTLCIASFNVENYLDDTAPKGRGKSAESKAEVRRSICAINPDVLALQEMGSLDTLMELRDSLRAEGCEFPHWEHIAGCDADIHLAILSKFPFAARRPHSDDSFVLRGSRFRVRRGFGEVDVEVSPHCAFTLITAHLKSGNAIQEADESELRLAEARLLREKIDAHLTAAPDTRLVVLGDFNDTQDSAVIRTVIGQDPHRLIDTRPAEGNGQAFVKPNGPGALRTVAWTNYHPKEDSYTRIDYLLISRNLAPNWLPSESYVLASPNWGIASDHRPVVAAFRIHEGVL